MLAERVLCERRPPPPPPRALVFRSSEVGNGILTEQSLAETRKAGRGVVGRGVSRGTRESKNRTWDRVNDPWRSFLAL